ncbi:MAG: GNAT family N-acetyltransferase [Bacteroidota bacterium]
MDTVLWLFEQAMALQGKNGYKVWDTIDKKALQLDIQNGLQYKILKGNTISCIFSIQYTDPLIWRERDRNDAVYLHRIVVNPELKGQKQFAHILNWARQFAEQRNLSFVRMDTWADNEQLIAYYKSFEFTFIETYRTPDAPELPLQNRNLDVALLQLKINN